MNARISKLISPTYGWFSRSHIHVYIYNVYVCMYRPSGAHRAFAHAPNLRETPTRTHEYKNNALAN